jgi:hypothetical protein
MTTGAVRDHEYQGYALSYGGGINSTALVILLASEGWRGPILYATTGTEWPETDAYVAMFEREWLAPRGLSITRLGAEWRQPHQRGSVIEYCEHYRLTPRFDARFCTSGWKVEPQQKWCAANGQEFGDLLVGISAEEGRRMPDRIRPLVDRHIDRNGCARIIADAGLPLPSKSACWVCPFQGLGEWRHLYQTHRDLYERAAALERAATERRGKRTVLMAGNDMTLDELATRMDAQTSWLDTSDYYTPCLCRI